MPIETVRAALDAEIARLQNELAPADEMERIRTQIASSFVRSRQTYNNIAVALVLWWRMIRFEYALIVTTATAAVTLAYSSPEPYAAMITVLLPPMLVLTWSGLRAGERSGDDAEAEAGRDAEHGRNRVALQFAGLPELDEGRENARRRGHQAPVGIPRAHGELPSDRKPDRQHDPKHGPQQPRGACARRGLRLDRGFGAGRHWRQET